MLASSRTKCIFNFRKDAGRTKPSVAPWARQEAFILKKVVNFVKILGFNLTKDVYFFPAIHVFFLKEHKIIVEVLNQTLFEK